MALSEKQVLEKFAPRGTVFGQELYLPQQVAAEFVSICDENDLAIIGIEAFEKTGDQITPIMDYIADYSRTPAKSWQQFRRACNSAAEEFVMQPRPTDGLRFNFVTTTTQGWETRLKG